MSADGKRLRETRERVEAEGLELVSVSHGKHVKLMVRAPDGRERTFIMAASPSGCFEKKQRSEFRRFAREGRR